MEKVVRGQFNIRQIRAQDIFANLSFICENIFAINLLYLLLSQRSWLLIYAFVVVAIVVRLSISISQNQTFLIIKKCYLIIIFIKKTGEYVIVCDLFTFQRELIMGNFPEQYIINHN